MTRSGASRLILVIGGAASGKSHFALTLAEGRTKAGGSRAFVATAEPLDSEMAEKIRCHQKARGPGWDTAEVPRDLAEWFLAKAGAYDVVLLDCLTLWLANLDGSGLGDPHVVDRVSALLDAMRGSSAVVVVVTIELGLGLVPMDLETRRFRELAGRVNQQVAAAADEMYLVVSGVPLRIKP